MAKHVNQLIDNNCPRLSTLNINGVNTDPGIKTGKALIEAHYPEIQPKKSTKIDRNKSIYSNMLIAKYDWINKERLENVFRGFKSKKSPGPDGLRPQVLTQLPNNILEYLSLIHI